MKKYTQHIPTTISYSFLDLFKLRPSKRGRVLVYNRSTGDHVEKEIYRYYRSYLNSPIFNPKTKKSYMFSDKEDTFRQADVEEEFVPFLHFAKSIDVKYNQMTVNWYDVGDYIEMHSDCTANMLNIDSPILHINLYESNDILKINSIVYEDKVSGGIEYLPLTNNSYHIIDNNATHRHGVGPGSQKRISITFRMIKER